MASKAAELRDLPADELHARIDSAKEELFNLRFQLATGQLDNPARMRVVRHEVARIATVLREREIEEEGLVDISAPETGPETGREAGSETGSEDGSEDGEDRQ
jgi:large subunit ribosomal protein L29